MEPSEGYMEHPPAHTRPDREAVKTEVREAIKSGTDREGAILAQAVKESVTASDPDIQRTGPLRAIAVEYNQAFWTANTPEGDKSETADANKLVVSLQTLHRQIGKDYDPTIEIHASVPENERRDMLIQKLRQDYDQFPDQVVEWQLEGYVDARAAAQESRGKLHAAVSVDVEKLSRADVRTNAFEVKRAEDRAQAETDKLLARTGLQDEYEMNVLEARGGSIEDTEGEDATRPIEPIRLEPSQETPETYQDQVPFFAKNVDVIVLDIQAKQAELANLAETSNDLEAVCNAANEMKQMIVNLKQAEGQLKVAVAGQKNRDAWNDYTRSGEVLADSFQSKNISSPEAATRVVVTFVDALKAKGTHAREQVAVRLDSWKNKAENWGGTARENAMKLHIAVTGAVGEVVGENLREAAGKFKADTQEVRAQYARVDSVYRRGMIDVRQAYYDDIHNLAINKDRELMRLALTNEENKRKLGIMAAEVMGEIFYSDERKAGLQARKDRLEGAVDRLAAQRTREIEGRENPHYQFFTDQLDQYIIEAPPPVDLIQPQVDAYLQEHEFDSLEDLENDSAVDYGTVVELRRAVEAGGANPDPELQHGLDDAEEAYAIKERARQIRMEGEFRRYEIASEDARQMVNVTDPEQIRQEALAAENYLAEMRRVTGSETGRTEDNLKALRKAERDSYTYNYAMNILNKGSLGEETQEVSTVDATVEITAQTVELHNTSLENAIRRYIQNQDAEDLRTVLEQTEALTVNLPRDEAAINADPYVAGVRGLERIAADLLAGRMRRNIAQANLTQLSEYQKYRREQQQNLDNTQINTPIAA